jgi:hypothetical protein
MEVLSTEQKTTQQVADMIGSSWETAFNYLNIILYVQSCPNVVMSRVGKRIHTWKREWGRLPQ